jgi:TldD protein
MTKSSRICIAFSLLLFMLPVAYAENSNEPIGMLGLMQQELERSMANLQQAAQVPLYYLQYEVTEERKYELTAENGGLNAPVVKHERYLDVDARVGAKELDNTHEIRSNNFWDNYFPSRNVSFPLDNNSKAIRAVLWAETEYQYQKGLERFTKVLANRQVKVAEEDQSSDYSPSDRQEFSENVAWTKFDTTAWQGIVARTAQYFTLYPSVVQSTLTFGVKDVVKYITKSDGSRIQEENHYLRFIVNINGKAEDGMELERSEVFSAASFDHMPDEATVRQTAQRLVAELEALIKAPLVQPFIGPAILCNRASGVFFHEIFGHRIEGHRQKSEAEGQTFTKKVNEQILPAFISVYDDPTLATYKGDQLRGYYKFDDEGTPAQRVTVVENGILRNFLTSCSPINNFPKSNGHGRREYGEKVVSRQGNLVIQSSKVVSYDQLRKLLIEECKKQSKEYGLIFKDISGGFTMTGRRGVQAFKVLPLLVYRVYADGRPDEVVRGVDIVGTPLTSFSKIIAAADDDDVFNGTCGAESGMVPVSAISPSILVSEIEVEKRAKEQEKPPILPAPKHSPGPGQPPGFSRFGVDEMPAFYGPERSEP